MKKLIFSLTIQLFFFLTFVTPIQAQPEKLGMHLLHPEEMDEALSLIKVTEESPDTWYYVTIPYTLEDVEKQVEWQQFFDTARERRVIPIVRLATKIEGDYWVIPSQRDVVRQIDALSQLHWPTNEKRILVYNEVNHAKEWGGKIDPAGYAKIFRFAASWASSADTDFIVMPAAMDLAAPTGKITRDAFGYLDDMYRFDKEIFTYADAWNSHSYPNPGFSASPSRTGRNSLRGFEHELAYLKSRQITDLPVYITETGWEENAATRRYLSSYYQYAVDHIWSNPQIVAVTPFVFKGEPGPFAGFSFVRGDGTPTNQYLALQRVLQR